MSEVRRWPDGRTITPEEAEVSGILWKDVVLYTSDAEPSK